MATKTEEKKAEKKTPEKKGEYFYAVGRRKRSIATVRLYPKGKGEITIVNNNKTLEDHIPVDIMQESVRLPLKAVGYVDADVTVKVSGGGIRGQADAIRLGISRALLGQDPLPLFGGKRTHLQEQFVGALAHSLSSSRASHARARRQSSRTVRSVTPST